LVVVGAVGIVAGLDPLPHEPIATEGEATRGQTPVGTITVTVVTLLVIAKEFVAATGFAAIVGAVVLIVAIAVVAGFHAKPDHAVATASALTGGKTTVTIIVVGIIALFGLTCARLSCEDSVAAYDWLPLGRRVTTAPTKLNDQDQGHAGRPPRRHRAPSSVYMCLYYLLYTVIYYSFQNTNTGCWCMVSPCSTIPPRPGVRR
jgi:hypothetical protein